LGTTIHPAIDQSKLWLKSAVAKTPGTVKKNDRWSINSKDPASEVMMKNLIAVYVLVGSSVFSVAQTVTEPHGEGSVVFGSPGGKWQKAMITDQLTGESSTAYSLDAETSATDIGNDRHPRIAFSCQKSGEFGRIHIRTGTVLAIQSHSISESSLGWARVSTHSEHRGTRTWTADIAKNGSDFLADKGIISDLLTHKKFVINFSSVSGDTITDEYLTDGLSVQSLRADCPALFKKR
jgi:hypothetical protein